MKTLIQQAGDYSLCLELDPVPVTDGVRLRFQTYYDSAKDPEDPRTMVDLHMSKKEFAVLCRALTVFSVQN